MGKRKNPYKPKIFESRKTAKNTFGAVYSDMMISPAWKDLSPGQKTLYLHMKERMYGEDMKTRPDPNDNTVFTFPRNIWSNLFGLYSRNNQSGFYRDRDALIGHGFIICVWKEQNRRRSREYQYSSEWKYWNKEKGLDIPPEHMSSSMMHKLTKAVNTKNSQDN